MVAVLFNETFLTTLGTWVADRLLTDSCDILRKTTSPRRSSGGATATYPTVETVPCAVLDAGTPAEMAVASQEVGTAPKLILVPRGTSVLGTDYLKVGSITYRVVEVYGPTSYEVVRRVLVQRSSLPQ